MRVSKAEQNLGLQQDETAAFLRGRPSWTLVETYQDHGISGAKDRDKRPALDKLMAAARKRGARLGRPRARLDDDELHRLRAKGLSVRKIAETLKVGSSTIQRRLGGAAR